jgi:renalase
MTKNTAIIGAGMAGLACADALVARGHRVHLFDKGRGLGGRMSSRQVGTDCGVVSFDYGAQYFTVRDDKFRQRVAQWKTQNLVAPWPLISDDAWVGIPGMSAIVAEMASTHEVTLSSHIKSLKRTADGWYVMTTQETDGPFESVVVALPAEQAAALLALHDLYMAREAMMARSQPCWTVMLAFADSISPKYDILRDAGPIAWAARNCAKPSRVGPEAWIIQATGSWSAAQMDQPEEVVVEALTVALQNALAIDLPRPIFIKAHRWRFALSAGTGLGSLWNPELRLGACGDWLLGPRVECAWLSGNALGNRLADSLSEYATTQNRLTPALSLSA